MRRLSADISGVMDMPVRLLIASVLTAAIIPVFYGAYEDLSMTRTEEGILREIDEFLRISRTLLDGGEGGRIGFDFNLESRMNAGSVSVIMGGPIDGDGKWTSFAVRYRINGGCYRYVVSKPPLQITSHDLEGLPLGEGSNEIMIQHAVVNGTHLIMVGI
ncbi:MAG: hypothetical protein ACMUIG_01980 [Thermoplasmatota archaeon]